MTIYVKWKFSTLCGLSRSTTYPYLPQLKFTINVNNKKWLFHDQKENLLAMAVQGVYPSLWKVRVGSGPR